MQDEFRIDYLNFSTGSLFMHSYIRKFPPAIFFTLYHFFFIVASTLVLMSMFDELT